MCFRIISGGLKVQVPSLQDNKSLVRFTEKIWNLLFSSFLECINQNYNELNHFFALTLDYLLYYWVPETQKKKRCGLVNENFIQFIDISTHLLDKIHK